MAARVDRDVRAAPRRELAYESSVTRRDRGLRPATFGEGPPQRRWLHRDDARARATEELRHKESDDPLPEDRDDLAEARFRVEHDVDRSLEIGEEHALLGCGAVRQPPHERLAYDVLILMRV